MSTGSIKHNIEIANPADAERFVEALEEAERISEEGMERLTDRDCCGMGICGGTCGVFADCGQCNFRHKINNRLAAYEDTGLTPEQIQNLQQEIDRLKHSINNHIKWNEAHTKARVEQGELIDKLIKDKDEQAGRIIQLDNGLKKLRSSLQWLKETIRDLDYKAWSEDKIDIIDELLGGAKDGK